MNKLKKATRMAETTLLRLMLVASDQAPSTFRCPVSGARCSRS